MRVLVTGGTGTLGRPAARRLLEQGHEVRVLSRQPSPALPGGVSAVRGDLSTGAGVAEAVERWPLVPLPVSWRFQPVAAEEAAARAVDLLLSGPHGRAPDFGGPEVTTLGDMARVWQLRRGRPRRVVRIALPGRVARGFRLGLNTCPASASRGRRWAEHVAGLSGVGCGLALGDHNQARH